MTTLYFDKAGKPISSVQWAKLYEEGNDIGDYRRIGRHEEEGLSVSTVWLGYSNDVLEAEGPPLIFETLIQSETTEETHRYPTLAAAEAGHAEAVRMHTRHIVVEPLGERMRRAYDHYDHLCCLEVAGASTIIQPNYPNVTDRVCPACRLKMAWLESQFQLEPAGAHKRMTEAQCAAMLEQLK